MSSKMIEKDNPTLTFLLGYLDIDKWRDSLKQGENKELIMEFIKIQDKAYRMNMLKELISEGLEK